MVVILFFGYKEQGLLFSDFNCSFIFKYIVYVFLIKEEYVYLNIFNTCIVWWSRAIVWFVCAMKWYQVQVWFSLFCEWCYKLEWSHFSCFSLLTRNKIFASCCVLHLYFDDVYTLTIKHNFFGLWLIIIFLRMNFRSHHIPLKGVPYRIM